MSEPYCGTGKIPKNSKRGSMIECAKKGQVRYYGLKKIDSRIIENVAKLRKKKVSKEQVREKVFILKARVKKMIKNIKAEKDQDTKDKMKVEAKKVVVQLNEANAVLKQLKKASRYRKQQRALQKQSNDRALVL
jgi:hypothetical protein